MGRANSTSVSCNPLMELSIIEAVKTNQFVLPVGFSLVVKKDLIKSQLNTLLLRLASYMQSKDENLSLHVSLILRKVYIDLIPNQ